MALPVCISGNGTTASPVLFQLSRSIDDLVREAIEATRQFIDLICHQVSRNWAGYWQR